MHETFNLFKCMKIEYIDSSHVLRRSQRKCLATSRKHFYKHQNVQFRRN